MYTTPLVRIEAEGEWSADMDSVVVYRPQQPFPASSWDWIGLYKVPASYFPKWVKASSACFCILIVIIDDG